MAKMARTVEHSGSLALSTRGRKSRIEVYARLDEGLEQLKRIGGLPTPIEAEDIWGDIWYAEAHNSTAIEGNTLVLKEVEVLLRDGRAVGNKQLRDYLEVRGYGDAAQWVYSQALAPTWTDGPILTVTEVREIHRLAMEPVWKVDPHPVATHQEEPGQYRHHDVHPFPGGMRPAAWTDIDALMYDWVDMVCAGPHPERSFPEVVADWFAAFERIHPFLDGNGRTGRLVTNLILIRQGYPPAIIYKRQRAKYLIALQKADAGIIGPLGEFLARAILDTLYQFIVPAIAGPHRLVPLAALADHTVTHRALREAAERGRLRAQRGKDGQWHSTRKWVEEYKDSRWQRKTSKPHSGPIQRKREPT